MTFAKDWAQDWSRDWASNFDGSVYTPLMSLNNFGEFVEKPTPTTTITNTRTGSGHAFFDHEGVYVETLASEKVVDGARRERTLSSTLTTHSVTVEVDRDYQISVLGDSGSTCVLSGAATGTLTNDSTNRQAFDAAKTATTTSLTLTITGTLTQLQVEDVTGRSNTAPSAHIVASTDYGFGVTGVRYYATTNGNSVAGGVVTEADGTLITPTPELLAMPERENSVKNSFFSELGGGGSDVFDDWNETTSGSSTINQETADLPAGFTTGLRLDIDGSGSNAQVTQTARLNVGAGGIATMSAWIKAANASGLKFLVRADDGAGGNVEILSSDGSSWLSSGGSTFNPTDLPTDWDKWEFTLPPTNAAQTHVLVVTVQRSTGSSVSHRVTALQLEPGTKATYPIKTTTAAVTRDNDQFDITEFSSWFNADEGIALFAMTETGDWSAIGGTRYLYGGSPARLVYRNNISDGVIAYDGLSSSTAYFGHTPGQEVLIAVIWSAALNALVIGYSSDGGTTFAWDATPSLFSGFSPAANLNVFEIIAELCRARGLAIYDGLPPGSDSSITDVETWCEDNIVGVIDGLKKS